MTSPAKPAREFWIAKHEGSVDRDKLTHIVLMAPDQSIDSLHVIEYAAFRALEERLALAEEALGFYADEKNWYLEIDPTTHSEFRKTIDLKDTDHFGYQASPESKNILQVIAGKTARDYFDSVKKEEGK